MHDRHTSKPQAAEPVCQLATGVAVLKLVCQPHLSVYQFLSKNGGFFGFKMHQKTFSTGALPRTLLAELTTLPWTT